MKVKSVIKKNLSSSSNKVSTMRRYRSSDAAFRLCYQAAVATILMLQSMSTTTTTTTAFSPHFIKSMTLIRAPRTASISTTPPSTISKTTNVATQKNTNKSKCPLNFTTPKPKPPALEMVAATLPAPLPTTQIDKKKAMERYVKDDLKSRTTLDVRIHGTWYDLSKWRKAHPAGAHWIDWYNGRDATEVMDAFHSDKARKMFPRLPKSKPGVAEQLQNSVEGDSHVQIAFRKLRDRLELEGWWKRDIGREVRLIAIYAGLVIGGAITARARTAFQTACSIMLLSLSFTQAGWLGHDYVHGIDKWSDTFRQFPALCGGLGVTWWSDKHNKHHALTNEMGVDEDLATDPFLYTWAPDPKYDSPIRKFQHYIFWLPFSALFALWRVDTVQVAIKAFKEKRPSSKEDLRSLGIHYAVLFALFPFRVWFPAVFISGLMSATIVTPTHQDEEMFEDFQMDWVTAQFASTRNAVCTNPFSEWLWGGMQYQLEHHLFPTMPRAKYPALKPILQRFCKDVGMEDGYRETGEFQILYDNWKVYRRAALADPVAGAPCSRGDGQLGAIDTGNSPAAKQVVANKGRGCIA